MENESLVGDLLEWVFSKPRTYSEVMAAWRTSCPRLSIWEDSVQANLLRLECANDGSGTLVRITETGMQFLQLTGRLSLGEHNGNAPKPSAA